MLFHECSSAQTNYSIYMCVCRHGTHWVYLQYLKGVVLNVVLLNSEDLVDHEKQEGPQHNDHCIPAHLRNLTQLLCS